MCEMSWGLAWSVTMTCIWLNAAKSSTSILEVRACPESLPEAVDPSIIIRRKGVSRVSKTTHTSMKRTISLMIETIFSNILRAIPIVIKIILIQIKMRNQAGLTTITRNVFIEKIGRWANSHPWFRILRKALPSTTAPRAKKANNVAKPF